MRKKIVKTKFLYLFIVVIIIASCKNKSGDKNADISTSTDSIKIQDQKEIRSIGETLLPEARKKVENWTEYQQLDQLLINFYSISPNEALNLSQELSTTTQQLKDSVKIERFKQPDIGIRLNVLHNTALRLADMATIPSILPTEVKQETQNILDAFSSLNSKINNITRNEKLEAELRDFQN